MNHLTRGRVRAPPSLPWGSPPFPGLHGPPSFRTWASAPPAGFKSPQPTSALAAGTAGADPWPRGHGGRPGPRGSQASSRFTPRCSLVPSTRPQKRRHIPEESTNKWRQRVKTAMAGVKLVLFSFGGNASLDCVQTIQARCVFPQQTLTVVVFNTLLCLPATPIELRRVSRCHCMASVGLCWGGRELVKRACHGCLRVVLGRPTNTHATRPWNECRGTALVSIFCPNTCLSPFKNPPPFWKDRELVTSCCSRAPPAQAVPEPGSLQAPCRRGDRRFNL